MNDALAKLWHTEYNRKGIPSSNRQTPSKAVVDFLSFLKEKNFESGCAIDLGCGKGRNSYFLAASGFDVTSLDLVEENVEEINNNAEQLNLNIKAFCQSVTDPWPVSANSLDIAIDIFCYKHITDQSLQRRYRSYLASTLKPGGYYLINLADKKDGFYGSLKVQREEGNAALVTDPVSLIPSYLYTLDGLINEFKDEFNVVLSKQETHESDMYGKIYTRHVLTVIFQRI